MPTYGYRCSSCGYEFERFHSIMAEPIKRCPECGKAKVKRLLGTGAGILFKGSGFYTTDYRSESYKDKAKADTGAAPAAEGDKKSSSEASSTESKDKPATSEKKESKTPAAEPKAEPKPSGKSKGKGGKGS